MMMDWLTVLSLIIVGIVLIVIELIFIPGTTIVGILGVGMFILAQFLAFSYFSKGVASGVLVSSLTITAGVIIYSLKGESWNRFSLKKTISSKVNEGYTSALQIEQRGHTISALRPIGKAEFDGKVYEVRTYGDYIDSNSGVKIIDIKGNKIIVELINHQV